MPVGITCPQPEGARPRLSQRAVWRWEPGSVSIPCLPGAQGSLVHGTVEGPGHVPATRSEGPRPGPAEPKASGLAATRCAKGQDLMEETGSGPAASLGSERLDSIPDVFDVTTFSWNRGHGARGGGGGGADVTCSRLSKAGAVPSHLRGHGLRTARRRTWDVDIYYRSARDVDSSRIDCLEFILLNTVRGAW